MNCNKDVGFSLDHPDTTTRRRDTLRRKSLLRAIYGEWYQFIRDNLPDGPENCSVLELGSGPGYLKEFLPNVITSEILDVDYVDRHEDALSLSFGQHALDAIVMTDVLHHIAEPRRFFREAVRVLRPGGRILCVEPWNTSWSRWIYTHFHHEPFEPQAANWELAHGGPLSVANGALPWILLHRDRSTFEDEFPAIQVKEIQPTMPFVYLLSGGFTGFQVLHQKFYSLIRSVEKFTVERRAAMFARLVLEVRPTVDR